MITESSTRKIGDVDVVEISGRLSLGNTLMSIEKSILDLITNGSRKLVVHVAGLAAIDSAGLGMLMSCSGRMEQHHGKLRIAGAQAGVLKTLEIVHMNRMAPMDGDLETACRELES
jgi:anti-anti-sigma factor